MKRFLLLIGLAACTPEIVLWPSQNQPSASPPAIANPASVHCEQNNGRLVIVNSIQGQAGYCVFQDRSACEEWAYFRNQCKVGDNPNWTSR